MPHADVDARVASVTPLYVYPVKSCAVEPLATLARYRRVERGVLFAQNLVHSATGRIAVGDALSVRATRAV